MFEVRRLGGPFTQVVAVDQKREVITWKVGCIQFTRIYDRFLSE